MTTPAHPTAHQAARDLATLREGWGALLAAISTTPTRGQWPPAHTREWEQPDGDGDGDGLLLVADRAPLVLRPHPAPIDVDAHDTAVAIERDIFALADTTAAIVQHPDTDHDDPRRWAYQQPDAPDARTAAGSRAHGLHWAALYLAGRVMGDDTDFDLDAAGAAAVAAPFRPAPDHLVHEIARAARECVRRMVRVIDPEHISRAVSLPTPCPQCSGTLTATGAPSVAPVVTCACGQRWEWPTCIPLMTGRTTVV